MELARNAAGRLRATSMVMGLVDAIVVVLVADVEEGVMYYFQLLLRRL